MYKTWFMSKMVAYSIHTPLYDRYAYNWIIERFNATQDSSAIYILMGLRYVYQNFNGNALAQNKIIQIQYKHFLVR